MLSFKFLCKSGLFKLFCSKSINVTIIKLSPHDLYSEMSKHEVLYKYLAGTLANPRVKYRVLHSYILRLHVHSLSKQKYFCYILHWQIMRVMRVRRCHDEFIMITYRYRKPKKSRLFLLNVGCLGQTNKRNHLLVESADIMQYSPFFFFNLSLLHGQ